MESIKSLFTKEQRWHSFKSTHLPSMWPGFKFRCQRHMWLKIICLLTSSLLCFEIFLWVLWFSPLVKNQHFQIPIWPEIIRWMKNHFVEVLPLNFVIVCLFNIYLFTGYYHTLTCTRYLDPLLHSREKYFILINNKKLIDPWA